VSSALYQIYALTAALIALRRQTSQDIPHLQPRVLHAKPDATYDNERPLLIRPGLSRKRSWPLSDIRVVDLVLGRHEADRRHYLARVERTRWIMCLIPAGTFGGFWNRLSRSTPVIGLAASLLVLSSRLERERNDDAAYRAALAKLHANPEFPNHSERRMRRVIAGEIAGHCVSLGVGYFCWQALQYPRQVFLIAWVVAFVADWAGGRLGAWSFDRLQPSTEEIVRRVLEK